MSAAYGIIGYPLGHSFSAGYFTQKFARLGINATYAAFPIEHISQLPALLQTHPNLRGLNVTIPYKQSVITYLDAVDPVAQQVGAVNCIAFTHSIKKGYNTDITGFRNSLLPLLQPHHRQALILGTGGAAKAVAYVLDHEGIDYTQVARTPSPNCITYDELTPDVIATHLLIINTTPLGMHPNINACPAIPYSAITPAHLAYDLVYNPAETKFLSLAAAQGAVIKNGLEMLHLQAEAAWHIWNS